ncbi:MAG: SpoVG family protein [Clostridiales bacterium]|nr:SpoVG family protein [Clostridiales bacterium]
MTIKAEITRTFEDKGALLASAAVIFDDCFIVKNLRVIEGRNGLFVAMPNFKGKDGRFIDSCFPLNNETRTEIQQAVLEAYDSAGNE